MTPEQALRDIARRKTSSELLREWGIESILDHPHAGAEIATYYDELISIARAAENQEPPVAGPRAPG